MRRSAVTTAMETAARERKARETSVLKTFFRLPRMKVRNTRPKLMPARSMATVRTLSAAGLAKEAMLALRVQKPQVLQADMAVVAASNQPMPVSRSATPVRTVREI